MGVAHVKMMFSGNTSIELYNGSVVHYRANGKQSSVFNLMQKCAEVALLSSSPFYSCLITNKDLSYFALPYNRNVNFESEGPLYFRYIRPHSLFEVEDLAHNNPESFTYLYHQTKHDLYNHWEAGKMNNDLFFECVALEYACYAKSLNLKSSQNKALLNKLITVKDKVNENSMICIKNNIDIITKFFSDFMTRYDTVIQCRLEFVNLVSNEAKTPSMIQLTMEYSVSVDRLESYASEIQYAAKTISISNKYIELSERSESIYNLANMTASSFIEYEEVKEVKISWKTKLVKMFLQDKTVVAVSFSNNTFAEMETFLTLVDLFFRFHVKSQMLLETVDDQGLKFHPVSMKHNDLNSDETGTNLFNIIERCREPLYYIDYRKAERMLREHCSLPGWYVVFTQESGLYLFFLVFNSDNTRQVVKKTIYHQDGRFSLNKTMTRTYPSLEKLISSMVIAVEQKEIRLNLCVTEEMSLDMRTKVGTYGHEHKAMHFLSQYCLLTSYVCGEFACDVYEGYWAPPCGIAKNKNEEQIHVRSFKYEIEMFGDDWYEFLEEEVQKVSKPEVIHQNILTCFGMYSTPKLTQTHVVYEYFGDNLQGIILDSLFTNEELFDFGWQIICGLLFLHNQDIVHGFPALHNIYIDPYRKQVKIAKVGILSSMLRGLENHSEKFFLFDDNDSVNRPNVGYHPGRWLHRNILLLNDTIKEEVDRYVFGCTLWQLFNQGDLPLKNVTDMEIVEKLKSKESGWFKVVLKMPHTHTELYMKLQKIIHICNTWGDNSEKYRFEEVAVLYEGLKGIANNNAHSTKEFMIQKQGDSLVFIQTNKGQSKPTYVTADFNNTEAHGSQNTAINDPQRSCLLTEEQLDSLELKEVLGRGQFGHVRRALVNTDNGPATVAVKVYMKAELDSDEGLSTEDIESERQSMINMRHIFIVPLLGMREYRAWTVDHSIQIVMPYYPCGSLNTYLDQQHPIPVEQLSCYGYQIASGMAYIHSKSILHRALAARNILVVNENHVVISDFMLSRDTGDSDYYYSRKTRTLPLLWYPPEYFITNKFSKAADVWSYAVTCWEIFSQAQQPYNDVEELTDVAENKLKENLLQYLQSGQTLDIPEDTPLPFQHIIRDCFQLDKEKRPDFVTIATLLNKDNTITQHIEHGMKHLNIQDDNVVVEQQTRRGYSNGNKAAEKINNIRKNVEEKGQLLSLSDFTFTSGKHPEPGQQVDAVCRKFSLNHTVWVKAYTKFSHTAHDDFVEEVKRLLEFEHKNIVPLKGCVMQDNMLMLVTPCYNFGTLRDYLDNEKDAINDKQKKTYCKQIASGMQYLSSHNCVHRDLRLCHVYLKNTNNLVIADFGLSRMCEAMYYRQHRNIGSDAFVVYPPEVIEQLCTGSSVKFSTTCDVWSYGILLWELYSSNIAYNDIWLDGNIIPKKLHHFFSDNKRLVISNDWPGGIQEIIVLCWKERNTRITFEAILEILDR